MKKLIAGGVIALSLLVASPMASGANPRPSTTTKISTPKQKPSVALDPQCFTDGLLFLNALYSEDLITLGEWWSGVGGLQESCKV